MTQSHARSIVIAVLCSWVLAAHVYKDFQPVRLKQVRAPLAAQQTVSVPLTGVEQITQPSIVIISRLGNAGDEPVTALASVDDDFLRKITIPARSSNRVDLVWTTQRRSASERHLNIIGSAPWTLEYLEIANLHGFTKGIVSFLIVPAVQPFARWPLWSIVLCLGWAVFVWTGHSSAWPRRVTRVYLVASVSIAVLLLLIAISSVISGYRILLPLQTFLVAVIALSLPEMYGLAERAVPAPLARRASALPWFRILAVVGFAAYAAFLATHVGAYAGGSDSSGYLNSARLLDSGHVTAQIRRAEGLSPDVAPEHTFVPLGFKAVGNSTMVPTYPIGLPLAVAAVSRLVGWGAAPNWTMVLHALAGVIVMFWLARECSLSSCGAALAALLLASSPLYLFSSLQFMSDVPALVWSAAAVTIAWHQRRTSATRTALAGVALSIAVLVRPTNVLALAPIAICLGLSARRWLWFAAGVLPGLVLMLAYNFATYGDPLTTGYGNISSEFSASFALPTLRYYVVWLPVLFTPICVFALTAPAIWRRAPALIAMLSVWTAVFCGFYAFYAHTGEMWSSLRFLLPAFPPLIIAGMLVVRAMLERWGPARLSASQRGRALAATAIVAALILVYNNFWSRRLGVLDVGQGDLVALQSADWAKAHLPRTASIFAMQLSGALFYYTDFTIVRYDDFTADGLSRMKATAREHRLPLYAVLAPFEGERLFAEPDGARGWSRIGDVRDVTIWAWRP